MGALHLVDSEGGGTISRGWLRHRESPSEEEVEDDVEVKEEELRRMLAIMTSC